jgi:hypothetical protein
MSRSLEPSSASTQRFAGGPSLVASAIVGLGVAADNVASASLVTVNQELENLLDSLDAPMVAVDAERCARRFTSSARRMVNVIASDIGRPIGDIYWNVRVDDVDKMVRRAAESRNHGAARRAEPARPLQRVDGSVSRAQPQACRRGHDAG